MPPPEIAIPDAFLRLRRLFFFNAPPRKDMPEPGLYPDQVTPDRNLPPEPCFFFLHPQAILFSVNKNEAQEISAPRNVGSQETASNQEWVWNVFWHTEPILSGKA